MNAWKRISHLLIPVLLLGLAPIGAAFAQKVTVAAATPAEAYQGTISLDVVVTGSGFDSSAKVQYFVSGTTNPGGIAVRGVTYRNSTELVTTIDVAETALLSSFDVQVTLSNGRKGKGTTLFSVKAKLTGPPPPPPPTYPAARAWHSFTSNGSSGTGMPRLYMFGGVGSELTTVPADLWFYSAYAHKWTLVTPAGTFKPGPRQHAGLSCGAGLCVLANGSNGVGLSNETWAYNEAANAWTQVSCSRRAPCPSPRQMVTMAFDPVRGNHVLFGGLGPSVTGYNDTFTFDAATLKWTVRSPTFKPSERNRAAALHIPGVGVVMHGGQPRTAQAAYCDMYSWNGSNWASVAYDTSQPHPCLHSHDMAWDGQRLVVTGGYVDTNDTPSPTDWRFTFAPDGRSGTWSQATRGTCQPIGGTDAEIHPGARMAYDHQVAIRVHFGGEMNTTQGVVRYDNTVECY